MSAGIVIGFLSAGVEKYQRPKNVGNRSCGRSQISVLFVCPGEANRKTAFLVFQPDPRATVGQRPMVLKSNLSTEGVQVRIEPREPLFLFSPSEGSDRKGLLRAESIRAEPLKLASYRIASCAMQRADAIVFLNVMRIPCFGRRMTIGRASIVWSGASWKSYFLSRSLRIIRICSIA
jgi:hypothetical protein